MLATNKLISTHLQVDSLGEKRSLLKTRFAPPFIPKHDIVRGIMHVGQTAITFAFMLAVMYVILAFTGRIV